MTVYNTEEKLMFFTESRQRRKRIDALRNDISALRARHTSELQAVGEKERIGLLWREHDEFFDLDRELCSLLERSIRARARRLGIDINSEWEEEEQSLLTDQRYWRLTRHGQAQLRGLIKNAQREEWKCGLSFSRLSLV